MYKIEDESLSIYSEMCTKLWLNGEHEEETTVFLHMTDKWVPFSLSGG